MIIIAFPQLLCFLWIIVIVIVPVSFIHGETVDGLEGTDKKQRHQCYPQVVEPHKIRLCVSSRYVPWLNETVKGMIHERVPVFCSKTSIVNQYFTLVNLSIPSHDGTMDIPTIEIMCDIVISVTSGRFTYDNFIRTKERSLLFAVPQKLEILLIWSDKMRWKKWMIDSGFEKHISRPINLSHPIYPFVLKEGLSENSQGVSIIESEVQLKNKLAYFKANRVTNYFGEEALTGMGRAQGILYVSAFRGAVLNMQCYLQLGFMSDVREQNFTNSVFIAGRPKDLQAIRGISKRISYTKLNVSKLMRQITKRAYYTGIYCAEFKMNNDMKVVFMEFNARTCFKLTLEPTYFMEAYLPLAGAVQQYLRTVKKTPRVKAMLNRSDVWFWSKEYRELARNYHEVSRKAYNFVHKLPEITDFDFSIK